MIIDAKDRVSFDQGGSVTGVVEATGRGNGGNILIKSNVLSVTNDAKIFTDTRGQGNAGNIIIDAKDSVSFDDGDVTSIVEQIAKGKGGDIRITTNALSATNLAQLSAGTDGQGDAGNIIINARDRASFNGLGFASSAVGEKGQGTGGNVQINTSKLFVTNGFQLLVGTRGQGNAGNIIINARDRVSFDGFINIFDATRVSGAFSSVDKTSNGKGGEIRITTGSLSVTNGAQIAAATRGQGNSGNLIINTRDNISINSINGITVSVDEGGKGNGGNIRITTDSIFVTDGAKINARTRGQGNAGNIQIKATDLVSVSGSNSTNGESSRILTSTANRLF